MNPKINEPNLKLIENFIIFESKAFYIKNEKKLKNITFEEMFNWFMALF